MKKTILLITAILLSSHFSAHAQFFKKLKKRAEEAAKETIIRKVEEKTVEKTEKTMDSILDADKKIKKRKKKKPALENEFPEEDDQFLEEEAEVTDIEILSKFDFVPGDKLLFYDDFSQDYIGDFPSRWNTNASGELVTINNSENKWLKIAPGFKSVYVPDVTNLPEEFTLEFDVIADGIDKATSSQAFLSVIISDDNSFATPQNYGMIEYSFCQFIDVGITVSNKINGKNTIRNVISADVRETVTKQHHVSIAINKQRLRMWINQTKYVDVPRLLPESVKMKAIKFNLRGTTNKESIYLSNVKIAEGGLDLRRELLEKGKFSTNGILFNSGSAVIQQQSYGILRQISQALQQDANMHLKIVGHTDSDGADDINLELSKQRAEAVKKVLISIYDIDSNRLFTEGKGETEPVADNNTPDGRALNRRVEFIKM